jgi:steroid 5-alpha reductase family enzyme
VAWRVFFSGLVLQAAVLSLAMTLAWWIWRRTRNSGWIDTVWTFAVAGAGIAGALIPGSSAPNSRQVVVAILLAAWALRLGLHIGWRTRGVHDDPRYAALIEGWGARAPREMFRMCQLQALLSIPMAFAAFLAAQNPLPLGRAIDIVGLGVVLAALAGEALADAQLTRFRADPANRGRVCDRGLWGWSRHPNYFFEWLVWVGFALAALDFTAAYGVGFIAVAGPTCMFWLLTRVSGIPPLEAVMLQSRGDAYRRYQQRVSAFFPLPPRAS